MSGQGRATPPSTPEPGAAAVPGQPSLMPGPMTDDEAALIAFRERAESGEHFLALLEEAGGDEDRLIVMAETAATLGQLHTVVDAAKQRQRSTARFTTAEQVVRARLERRAAAFTD